jgi:hypothetical protein
VSPPPTPFQRPPATDMMECRSCGRPERASEGYPCTRCGTFLCLICNFRGITLCKRCAEEAGSTGFDGSPAPPAPPAPTDKA